MYFFLRRTFNSRTLTESQKLPSCSLYPPPSTMVVPCHAAPPPLPGETILSVNTSQCSDQKFLGILRVSSVSTFMTSDLTALTLFSLPQLDLSALLALPSSPLPHPHSNHTAILLRNPTEGCRSRSGVGRGFRIRFSNCLDPDSGLV